MTGSISYTPTQVDLATARLEALIEDYRRTGESRLPREIDLSQQLGISRNTLREALARLAARGVIERRRRHGTVITDGAPVGERREDRPLEYPIDDIVSLPALFGASGSGYSIRSVAVETEMATPSDADLLHVEPGTPVYRVRRVFSHAGGNAAVGEHVLPTVLHGHGIHIEALTDGISTFLNEVEHISVDVVRHRATAIAADASTARDLQLPIGSPVLEISAELCTRDGDQLRIVAVGRLLFNPAKVTASATGHAR